MRLALVSLTVLFAALALSPRVFADEVAAGRAFKAKCAACHGPDGKGKTKQGEKMHIGDMTSAEFKKELTPDKIKTAILEGVNREKEGVKQEMKGFKGKMPDEQVEELVAFVRGLK